jgi:hypothetical protein
VASGFGYFVGVSNAFYPIWWPFHNDLNLFFLIFYATVRSIVWQNNAQWERFRMTKEGVLRSNSPHGYWELKEDQK